MKVSSLLAATILGFYFLSTIDCSDSIPATVTRTFQHAGLFHLILNLMALREVAQLEKTVGSCTVLVLVLMLIAGTTALEMIFPPTKCSVGLSGILFGVVTWRSFRHHRSGDAAALIFVYLISSMFSPNISFWGHAQGVAIGALIWFALGDRILC